MAKAKQKSACALIGTVVAQQHNLNRGKGGSAKSPEDFFPILRPDKSSIPRTSIKALKSVFIDGKMPTNGK